MYYRYLFLVTLSN